MSRKLAELLLKDKIISQEKFQEAQENFKTSKSYVRYLIAKHYVSETKLLYYLSQKFGLPSINLDKFEINEEIIRMVPADLVRRTRAVPIQANRGTLVVAICDPTSLPELQSMKFQLKMNVEAVLTTFSAFDRALQKHFGGAAFVGVALEQYEKEKRQKKDESADMQIELVEVHDIESESAAQDGPVITLVNGILSEAIRRMASDIHVEPYEHGFRVRMRIDGTLQEMTQVPLEMKRAVTARLKIMSRMDIAESRIPQDGRIKLRVGGGEIDFRVNSLPTLFGEKVVLRMLHKGALKLDLKILGFEDDHLKTFNKGIRSPNGMVLVTGPTGSGKTTTLYSALNELNKMSENLSTVEDPVEYNLEGINQVQVHKEIGLTFASVLRALLRQDPDIILVGEIRDYETAEVAVQAALTGHLVLSTLHTNDAPSTIVRLMNMGLEPFLVTASLNTIVAQRLVRLLCPKCKVEEPVPPERLLEIGIDKEKIGTFKTYTAGKGCPSCGKVGYKGRAAIYEVLDFSQDLKEMVLRGATALDLKKQAIKNGMNTLRHSALLKVMAGTTSLSEALTKTMES